MDASPQQLDYVLHLLPLAGRDRRACALVSKSWRSSTDAAWAASGISVRDDATNVLLQPRWDGLVRLRVWGPGDPSQRTPFHGLPRALPRLWRLDLSRVQLATTPGIFGNVFRQAPRLRHVELRVQMWARTYPHDLRAARSLLLTGADRLEHVALRGEGIVIYPAEPYVCKKDDAFVAAQESRSWLPVVMPRLTSYTNTGKQFCMLAVDAPLQEATIEEPDAGPWLVQRLGPACAGLRRLTWIVPRPSWRAAYPMLSVAQRFYRLERLDLSVRMLSNPVSIEAVLTALDSLPRSLRWLKLTLDQYLWPCGPCDWRKDSLAHLTRLEHVELWAGYATRGFEDAFGLLGARPATSAVVASANAHFPVVSDEDSDADADSVDDLEVCLDLLRRRAREALDRLPGVRFTTHNLPLDGVAHPRLAVQ